MIRFHYCISNPPYQSDASGDSNNTAHNIFHFFYDEGIRISDKTTMIFPGGRWMQRSFRGGEAADLIYPTVTQVEWFPNSNESGNVEKIFPGVFITDGISIVIGERNPTDTMILNGLLFDKPRDNDIVPLSKTMSTIVSKVMSYYDCRVRERKLIRNFFRYPTYYVERNPEKVSLYDDGNKNMVSPVVAWLADGNKGTAKRVRKYWVDRKDSSFNVMQEEVLGKYKVCCTAAYLVKNPDYSSYRIVNRSEVVGESWIIVGCFDTVGECNNYIKYLSSNLVRSLLRESKGGKTKTWGYFVPDLGDYSDNNPDIDWSEPLDNQLKKLFSLTEEEHQTLENNYDH